MLQRPRKFRTKNARAKHRKALIVRASIAVAALLILIGGLAYLSGTAPVTVSSVNVVGTSVLSEPEIQAEVERLLAGRYFGLFARRNVLLYPKQGLEHTLREAYPRLAEADASLEGLDRLVVRVRERIPAALWCGDIVPSFSAGRSGTSSVQEMGTCYFIDESGFIFDLAPGFDGPVYPRYYGALERAEPLGSQLVESGEFGKLQRFMALLAEKGFRPVALLLVDEADIEIYLEDGTKFLIARKGEPERTMQTISTVMSSEDITSATSTVEYVDFRFGKKVYYRFR